jgi:hypothetical protein
LAQQEFKIFLATPNDPEATVYAGQNRNLYAELQQLRTKEGLEIFAGELEAVIREPPELEGQGGGGV